MENICYTMELRLKLRLLGCLGDMPGPGPVLPAELKKETHIARIQARGEHKFAIPKSLRTNIQRFLATVEWWLAYTAGETPKVNAKVLRSIPTTSKHGSRQYIPGRDAIADFEEACRYYDQSHEARPVRIDAKSLPYLPPTRSLRQRLLEEEAEADSVARMTSDVEDAVIEDCALSRPSDDLGDFLGVGDPSRIGSLELGFLRKLSEIHCSDIEPASEASVDDVSARKAALEAALGDPDAFMRAAKRLD
jgi:hypothetical protein